LKKSIFVYNSAHIFGDERILLRESLFSYAIWEVFVASKINYKQQQMLTQESEV